MQTLLRELQKLTECIPIRTDCVRTRLALLHQALYKKMLQKRSKAGELMFMTGSPSTAQVGASIRA